MKLHRHMLLLLVAVASLGATVLCRARVYRNLGSAREESAPELLDGVCAYAARVTVNGGQADLAVLSFDGSFDAVMARLRARLFTSPDDRLDCGSGLAIGTVRTPQRVSRIVVAELDGKCVMFRLDQTPEEYAQSRLPPTGRQLAILPQYPGSTPSLFVHNESSGASLCVSRADADPETVAAFLGSSLESAGWTPAIRSAAAGDRVPAGGLLFIKGGIAAPREICIALTGRSGQDSRTFTSMLHKKMPAE